MDRDKRWERTQLALDAIVHGAGPHDADPARRACRRATRPALTDEFILPVVIDGRPRLDPAKDAAILFNFRPDRARQLRRSSESSAST